MRLEYTEEQEKQLRITEIEAILENNLREDKVEILALEVELQFLQGNTNSYGEPTAYVGIDSGETLEIIFDGNMEQYSMIIHDTEGNPMLPHYNADSIEELLGNVVVNDIEHKLLGTIVEWENERWYVDNTDENFKDDREETSLFLLPEKYADADENDKLMRFGNPDSVGFWVYESLVKAIEE